MVIFYFRKLSYLFLLFNSFGGADGTCRTDETAEVTADTLGAHQTGAAGLVVEDNGLMTTIVTRYLTASIGCTI